MAIIFSDSVRNAMLDVLETTIGTAPKLRIYDDTGTVPTGITDGNNTNVQLAEIDLPSDWMDNASGGVKAKLGTWTDASADASGTAAYFRIYDTAGATAHVQGTVTNTGGGGDMEVGSTAFTAGQEFTVATFTLTAGNS